MKIRYKAPSGGGTLELDDKATVYHLLEALKSSTGLNNFVVKYGWPLKVLSTDQSEVSLESLSLHRENLTIVPTEAPVNDASAVTKQDSQATQETTTASAPAFTSAPASTSAPSSSDLSNFGLSQQDTSQSVKDQKISVFMPETNSTLILRVMPDDNSCLFTAVGGALQGLRSSPDEYFSAKSLRRIVVNHIRANPEKYNAVILGKDPDAYCSNMLRPDVWGGEIELSVISEVFDIEISVVDVKTGSVYRIGQGNNYELRCILVYSNIHYDRVAEIFVEGQEVMEFDVTRWAVDGSDHVIAHAKELCRKLKEDHHYYTDTSDFVVTCAECGWVGQGQKAIAEHSLRTRHSKIIEIQDNS